MSDLAGTGLTASEIKDRLAQIRVQAGESNQKAMSLRLGLSPNAWRLMETGGGLPSADTLLRLADLGFSPTWVLTGQGPMQLGGTTAPAIIGPEPPAAMAAETAEHEVQGGPVGPPLLSPIARPDMLDAAFREALALVGIPAAQLGNPKKLMMLTLILYDRRAKQEADELAALLTEATAAHDKATAG